MRLLLRTLVEGFACTEGELAVLGLPYGMAYVFV